MDCSTAILRMHETFPQEAADRVVALRSLARRGAASHLRAELWLSQPTARALLAATHSTRQLAARSLAPEQELRRQER